MTNREAIKSMRNLDDLISITESEHESVKTAISALEYNSTLIEHISNLQNENTDFFNKLVESERENDKLKAEIEQLKEDYSVLTRQYDNVENSSIRYYNEVKQLKSELEQSVKFKEYFMELYNQGLEVSNWHLNGDTEPLTNFIDSALEEAEQYLEDKVEE